MGEDEDEDVEEAAGASTESGKKTRAAFAPPAVALSSPFAAEVSAPDFLAAAAAAAVVVAADLTGAGDNGSEACSCPAVGDCMSE
jgi:hypothetical protein